MNAFAHRINCEEAYVLVAAFPQVERKGSGLAQALDSQAIYIRVCLR
ncbi:MAG: hypothetical protein RMK67_00930 [Chloroflexota bacterium]|nr:hypothetical protein [Chloroflexota bacterium]